LTALLVFLCNMYKKTVYVYITIWFM
jgi:hypothetical protein